MKGLVLTCLVLSFVFGAGFIQTVGWVTMLPTQFVKTGSVTEAVGNTFGGNHPCGFCKAAERMHEIELGHSKNPEPRPSPEPQGAKDLLSSESKKLQVIEPATQFSSLRLESNRKLLGLNLDVESPPPQGA